MEHTELIPVSALQHWAYCPRQCGLILLEQAFDENVFTLRGRAVHAQVDQPGVELRKGLRIDPSAPGSADRPEAARQRSRALRRRREDASKRASSTANPRSASMQVLLGAR